MVSWQPNGSKWWQDKGHIGYHIPERSITPCERTTKLFTIITIFWGVWILKTFWVLRLTYILHGKNLSIKQPRKPKLHFWPMWCDAHTNKSQGPKNDFGLQNPQRLKSPIHVWRLKVCERFHPDSLNLANQANCMCLGKFYALVEGH